jgi:hypothetical protein
LYSGTPTFVKEYFLLSLHTLEQIKHSEVADMEKFQEKIRTNDLVAVAVTLAGIGLMVLIALL